jgi:hypothetical protein
MFVGQYITVQCHLVFGSAVDQGVVVQLIGFTSYLEAICIVSVNCFTSRNFSALSL